jgi:tetratricopeptide (TPR) repeat protein
MYSVLQDFDNGRKWLEMAKTLAKPEQKLGWSRYPGVRGRFEWQDEKDNAKATRTFIELYNYCMKNDLFSRALDAAHMVAITGDEKQKVEWALKGIKAAEKAGDSGTLAMLWNNLGWEYDEKGEVEKSFVALLKARKYHQQVGNDHSKLVADFAVAHAYRRNGMLEEAREWLTAAFNKAKARYDEDPKDKDRIEWLGWGHKYFGDLLMDEGNSEDAALTRYKQALQLLEETGLEKWWPEEHKELKAKIDRLTKENRESPKRE